MDHESTKGKVQFKNVYFKYPCREDVTVLNGFDLTIEPGQVVALVGPSGSGKSTTTALLERFYETTSGEILIDGVNLKDIDPHSLHELVGTVSQEPILFATSILENIRYGKPDATIEEVKEAARLANAHYFIEGFPDGYETVLGERGALLSGGQKQRVAIARAILSDPKILLLDEATSSLDNRSEKLVQNALNTLMKGRTTLIIAHRLTTVESADVICVVSDGKIIERGAHKSLLEQKDSHYRALFRRQNSRRV
uniref:ABC transporter domain-containing protein n=1 Tax=Aplanochytrium stocchinoi TaxID=215587 RepID=A0A7S3LMF4_9STRA|eukprot:CAMPEP_0204889268 /NCGR_PEP_ID=MMETSP1349-20130617/22079_1 /ASSEMBLY_ACC=CAM_ASM_000710 /TAXON_ID=215587 /ORGANISM="Aplanochytrium stocchinoi, Strain GSBS06" /LENGTH=253 /DNA_ID=CAMNT_0052053179 /DNA_START=9 /DNA_END=770 /DNA_ORIENTATION=-